MKVKASKNFSKLGSAGNWGGFGKKLYIQLESGKSVEFDCPNHLIDNGYVEIAGSKSNKKKESK